VNVRGKSAARRAIAAVIWSFEIVILAPQPSPYSGPKSHRPK
jgi:hypothetical protein